MRAIPRRAERRGGRRARPRPALEAHLASCAACRRSCAALRQALAVADDELARPAAGRAVARSRRAHPPRRWPSPPRQRLAGASAGASWPRRRPRRPAGRWPRVARRAARHSAQPEPAATVAGSRRRPRTRQPAARRPCCRETAVTPRAPAVRCRSTSRPRVPAVPRRDRSPASRARGARARRRGRGAAALRRAWCTASASLRPRCAVGATFGRPRGAESDRHPAARDRPARPGRDAPGRKRRRTLMTRRTLVDSSPPPRSPPCRGAAGPRRRRSRKPRPRPEAPEAGRRPADGDRRGRARRCASSS